jgi:hypothetical protein
LLVVERFHATVQIEGVASLFHANLAMRLDGLCAKASRTTCSSAGADGRVAWAIASLRTAGRKDSIALLMPGSISCKRRSKGLPTPSNDGCNPGWLDVNLNLREFSRCYHGFSGG